MTYDLWFRFNDINTNMNMFNDFNDSMFTAIIYTHDSHMSGKYVNLGP